MRISDWSSDVCSSDLFGGLLVQFARQFAFDLPAVDMRCDLARDEASDALRERFVSVVIIGRTGAPIVESGHGAMLGRVAVNVKLDCAAGACGISREEAKRLDKAAIFFADRTSTRLHSRH